MEAQERYWQNRLSAMRERHDAEVEGMRKMLNEKNAAARGTWPGGAERAVGSVLGAVWWGVGGFFFGGGGGMV